MARSRSGRRGGSAPAVTTPEGETPDCVRAGGASLGVLHLLGTDGAGFVEHLALICAQGVAFVLALAVVWATWRPPELDFAVQIVLRKLKRFRR